MAVAASVLCHLGGIATVDVNALAGVGGYAAVALPVLMGFHMAATRWWVRVATALAAVLALVAVTRAHSTLIVGPACGIVMFLRGKASGTPHRAPIVRGIACGLVGQLLLQRMDPGSASLAGWILLSAASAACVGDRRAQD